MRSFGVFGIVLVNCRIEYRYTSTEELFPTGHKVINEPSGVGTTIRRSLEAIYSTGGNSNTETIRGLMANSNPEPNVMKWTCNNVIDWLEQNGLSSVSGRDHTLVKTY